MTNKQAYLNINQDLGLMSHFFNAYNIDEGLEDQNELAGAFGFVARVMQADETQSKSSISLNSANRQIYMNEANRIFAKYDIEYDWGNNNDSEITAIVCH